MLQETLKKFFSKLWPTKTIEITKNTVDHFGPAERVIFYILSILLLISGVSLLYRLNESFLVSVPARGGELTEGILGSPRFINPVLAISDADRDLTSLIYSGLLKINSDGELINDLAESYKISEDGTTYTFTIKENAYFHNGDKVTSEDVDFTIQQILDPKIKSPKRSSWDQVKVEIIDNKTIRFVLKQPYSPFIQNTTIGILPKNVWKNVDADSFLFSNLNIKPIGSGPYKVEMVKNNDVGLPSTFELRPFKKFVLGQPFISKILLKFYGNEDDLLKAYENNEIESINSITPEKAKALGKESSFMKTSPLPRIFGVFFNQNTAPVFLNKEVRLALDKVLDKEKIISDVLYGLGQTLDSPLPNNSKKETIIINEEDRLKEAREILEKAGWQLNNLGVYEKKTTKETIRLAFSISTADTEELKLAAGIVKDTWQKLGAEVELKIFEIGDLNQNIIRPRKYDSLLFGKIIGKDLDLYPFWHSSQRNDPGLNISLYTNIKVDKIVEELRKTQDKENQAKLLEDFQTEIKNDIPAVFLYSPYFTYIYPTKIKNINFTSPTIPGERFSNINEWFIETNKIWKIFTSN